MPAKSVPAKPSMTLVIFGLVTSVFLPPLGIIISFITFRNSPKNSTERNLSILGIIVGAIPILLAIIYVLAALLISHSNIVVP